MKSTTKKITYWLVIIGLIGALTEWVSYQVLRAKLPGYGTSETSFNIEPSGYTVYHYSRNHQFTFSNKNVKGVATDSFGFIHPFGVLSKKKPNRTKRIFLCGGSTMAGVGQGSVFDSVKNYKLLWHSYKLSIAGYLQKELEQRFDSIHVQVINAATFGWQIHHSFHRYLEVIHQFEPDLIINMDGVNDALGLATGDPYGTGELLYQRMVHVLNRLNEPVAPFHTLNLLNTVFTIRSTRGEPEFVSSCVQPHHKWETYLERRVAIANCAANTNNALRHYAASLNRDSVRFLFSIQPVVYSSKNKALSPTETAFSRINSYCGFKGNKMLGSTVKTYKSQYLTEENVLKEQLILQYGLADTIANSWKQIVEAENGLFMNLQSEMEQLPADMEFYMDHCHLTEEANAFIARLFAKTIDSHHLLK